MTRTYNVVDADGHVLEPPDLWTGPKYLEQKYRDRAPRLVPGKNTFEWLLISGKLYGSPDWGLSRVGSVGVPLDKEMHYADGRKGGFDPHARIKDMDLDGIDAACLYPTLGLLSGAIEEPDFAAAVCRAYNRWIAEYCAPYPDRLFPVAMLPMQSVEATLDEMRFARRELGMRAGFLRPNPYNNRPISDPAYDTVWALAQELDMAMGFHEGTGGMPAVGVDRVTGYGARHIVSHTMEMQLASLHVIWYGICERFPRVRFGFLECGGGWMPAWLDRMDRHYLRGGTHGSDALRMKPSEYFRRQCWISFEPVEGTIKSCAEYLGEDKLLWATDYPHSDGFFPGAPQKIKDQLPEGMRQGVLAKGAVDFYKLPWR